MAHYGLSDAQVLDMPIRRFWLFSDSIDRMNAADDLRAIRVAAAAFSQEAYKSTTEKLLKTLGEVVVTNGQTRDREGIKELKAMIASGTF